MAIPKSAALIRFIAARELISKTLRQHAALQVVGRGQPFSGAFESARLPRNWLLEEASMERSEEGHLTVTVARRHLCDQPEGAIRIDLRAQDRIESLERALGSEP